MKESIPIVITAFGTTTKALKTYDHVRALVRKRFPGHEIRWAYTSRMVKDRVKRSRNLDFPDPGEVLSALHDEGHIWAVVLVGHGTDHPIWCAYDALEQRFQRAVGPQAHVGLVEGLPGPAEILDRVQAAGCSRVRLVPFMLVAGRHVLEDLAGPEDSWKAAFGACGIEVSLDEQGLGGRDGIIEIFGRHIAQALDVIPVDWKVKR